MGMMNLVYTSSQEMITIHICMSVKKERISNDESTPK